MSYAEFLASKRVTANREGIDVAASDVHSMLHPWQAELVQWACRIGRAAIWADTGLGKTVMQVEWLRMVTGSGAGLIVAPLAVCQQTIREAARLGVQVTYTRGEMTLPPGLHITNYEMLHHIDPAGVTAVVLDEASILKQADGKLRTSIIAWAATVPYRLSATATPAPNDPEELTNQAEFLGRMRRVDMLAAYFVHDDNGWRLKGHARRPMLSWMATWAVALRRPSDMGSAVRNRAPPRST